MCEQKGGKFPYLNGEAKKKIRKHRRKTEKLEAEQASWVVCLSFSCSFARERQHEQQIALKRCWNLPLKHQSSGFSIKAPCSLFPRFLFSVSADPDQLMLTSSRSPTFSQQQASWRLLSCATTTRFSFTSPWRTRAWSAGKKLHISRLGKLLQAPRHFWH